MRTVSRVAVLALAVPLALPLASAQAATKPTINVVQASAAGSNASQARVAVTIRWQAKDQFDVAGTVSPLCYGKKVNGWAGFVTISGFTPGGRQLSGAAGLSGDARTSCNPTGFSRGGVKESVSIGYLTVRMCETKLPYGAIIDCTTRRYDNPLV